MLRKSIYDYISQKISSLITNIKMNSKHNLLELNIHAENFTVDLLNHVYGYNLINANDLHQNMPGIDLIDKIEKLVFQITSTNSKDKINNTLEKEVLKYYANEDYRIKFMILDFDCNALKKKNYLNIHNIKFNSEEDILSYNDVLKTIKNSSMIKQREIFEFVKLELGEKEDIVKMDSNLTDIINVLSKENLNEECLIKNLEEFKIDEKIEFNNLQDVESIIDNYKYYSYKIDEKYREFDKEGKNKSISILNIFHKEYIKISSQKNKNDCIIFLKVIEKLTEIVQASNNYEEIPLEELDMCITMLTVDAFIRCKIFKNPQDYYYRKEGKNAIAR